ncbi:hypothetical protein IFM89_019718 [Coptis chinensis]|uniref:Endonuclease/exonuclease/phosphatase domain-containing protein n=1 Tax=Coptis chinensis TaxID=261450 RepID=A0A835LMS2_9MAGN|nr:hypothetical protein IFM89_019718 [Coptis chinensis]
MSKIDRVLLTNEKWLEIWNNSIADFKPTGVSDHSPCIVSWAERSKEQIHSFKFYNFWTNDDSLYKVIEDRWKQPVERNPMFVFTRKFKLLKKDIKLWAKSKFSNLEKRINDARIQLEAIQRQLQAQPRNTSLAQEEHSLT